MQEIKVLIEKFWAGTATDAEKQRLFEWIDSKGEQWRQLLENEYREELNNDRSDLLPGRSERILERLHGQIILEEGNPGMKRDLSIRRWTGWAAAAAIILSIGLGVYRLVPRENRNKQAVVAGNESEKARQLRRQINDGVAIQHIILEDGSAVDLYPGGRIAYPEPFGATARDLSLQGQAVFTVAKNPGAPFTVEAGGFTTTALGTQFMVHGFEGRRLSVVLLEGKIVVHAAPQTAMSMKDIYLSPGQELAVNIESKNYAVGKWKRADTASMAGSIRNKTQKLAGRPVTDYAFVFNKTPLAKVFEQLGDHYKSPIVFNEPDLKGLSFTGKIMQTDELRVVLSIICNTNDLTFRSGNGSITISKQK